ncbi:MAG: ATP-binding protein [Candidatus Eisenbacteria bacterium]
MNQNESNLTSRRSEGAETRGGSFDSLSRRILQSSVTRIPRTEFIREVSRMLLEFSACEEVELWLRDNEKFYRCTTKRSGPEGRHDVESNLEIESRSEGEEVSLWFSVDSSGLDRITCDVLFGRTIPSSYFTAAGAFWIGDTRASIAYRSAGMRSDSASNIRVGGPYASVALIPLKAAGTTIGLLRLATGKQCHFTRAEIEQYEQVTQNLAMALVHQGTQAALHERIKELTCLYGIDEIANEPNLSLENILVRIVDLLPPSWQYPEIAFARIVLDGKVYAVPGFPSEGQRQNSDIVVQGAKRGAVEVAYSEEKPHSDEGPFLKEERGLIDAVANQIAIVVERRRAEEEKLRLHEQLRHADRLATIGELAAGVAHELNEPLGNILGFAQLVQKVPDLPEQATKDVTKIVAACLYAREVIQKLMVFARQTSPKKSQVNLNDIVREGLYFLESRCAKQGIEIIRVLDAELPEVTADAAQLHQVLVNLSVNAIQAMPTGGKLTLRTIGSAEHISLVVEDTGIGMSEEVLKKIFIPFFTTKAVGQGLGLGLAVVHGIVSGHGGSIKVESKLGRCTRFEVTLPIT